LPNYLSVSGKTRQNDLDVAFTISINPGASTTGAGKQSAQQENRQAFLTFGDASWGSIKLGKDLGIYASDAILNDMTLLGVGSGAGFLAGNTTTLGRIGSGFMYADWKAQVAYTTPNWNGFNATVGLTQAWNASNSDQRGGSEPAFEGKASYAWTGDVAGKVWVSGISQKVKGVGATPAVAGSSVYVPTGASTNTLVTTPAVAAYAGKDSRAESFDVGATVNVAGFGLTGYYYDGRGIGQTIQLVNGFDVTGARRDSNGGYVQATYVLPTQTKIGLSWGESNLDGNAVDNFTTQTNEMWTIGAYHPITKHLNLVAEYSDVKYTNELRTGTTEGKAQTVSLGAILFF